MHIREQASVCLHNSKLESFSYSYTRQDASSVIGNLLFILNVKSSTVKCFNVKFTSFVCRVFHKNVLQTFLFVLRGLISFVDQGV